MQVQLSSVIEKRESPLTLTHVKRIPVFSRKVGKNNFLICSSSVYVGIIERIFDALGLIN